jgi:hypothetical protein
MVSMFEQFPWADMLSLSCDVLPPFHNFNVIVGQVKIKNYGTEEVTM